MRIAVFADKFSGTLTSDEVIGEIKKIFKYNNIKSSFFPVTDGGENSTEIFKEYGFETQQMSMKQDFSGKWLPVETLKVNKNIYIETSQLIGIKNTNDLSLDLNTSCLAKIIEDVDILSMGGSRTNDAGIGLLSKMGIDFLNNEEVIEDPKPKDFKFINNIKKLKYLQKIIKVTALKILVYTFGEMMMSISALGVGLSDKMELVVIPTMTNFQSNVLLIILGY